MGIIEQLTALGNTLKFGHDIILAIDLKACAHLAIGKHLLEYECGLSYFLFTITWFNNLRSSLAPGLGRDLLVVSIIIGLWQECQYIISNRYFISFNLGDMKILGKWKQL